jgi:uncharacterized protein YndB with AHSA1/START domain
MRAFLRESRTWIPVLVMLLLLGVVAVVAGGFLLPEQHEVTRTLTLSRTPEAVWRAISDSVRIRSWRHDIIQLEHLPDSAGHEVWREIGDDGVGTTVTIAEALPPVRLVTRRVSEARGPSSEWTYAIRRAPSGIDITITERGRIPDVAGRFISQFMSGNAAPVERYLTELAGYFEEPPRIR